MVCFRVFRNTQTTPKENMWTCSLLHSSRQDSNGRPAANKGGIPVVASVCMSMIFKIKYDGIASRKSKFWLTAEI